MWSDLATRKGTLSPPEEGAEYALRAGLWDKGAGACHREAGICVMGIPRQVTAGAKAYESIATSGTQVTQWD